MKQDSARVVGPTRRNFVKYDGKDSVEISCDEFLEMPYIHSIAQFLKKGKGIRENEHVLTSLITEKMGTALAQNGVST